MNGNELYHHGVKGQKWYQRRYQNKDGSLTNAGRKHRSEALSEDAKTANLLKKKKMSQMSNAELRALNERQNLEKTYMQMNKSHIAKGAAFIASAATITNTAINLYNNSSKLVAIGKTAGDRMLDAVGNVDMKDIIKGF